MTPPRTRVVFVDHCAKLSGGEIALLRTLAALDGHVDSHVILGEDGPLCHQLAEAGVNHEVLPLDPQLGQTRKDTLRLGGLAAARNARLLGHLAVLARRIRQLRADIVHTNSLKAAVYGGVAGRLAGRPVVWHIRDRIAEDYLPRAAVRAVHGLSLVLPSAVVANSRATRDTLPRRLSATVLPDPLPADVPTRRAAVASDGSFTVGVLGRLAPWKGQDVFLSAFAQAFGGTQVRARLVGDAMFGESGYRAELQHQAGRLGIEGQVEFAGFRSDIWQELAAMDLLVHCSRLAEPFGQVVLEGMAAGLPVIASHAGGPAEVIADGRDGLLVPPGDANALAAAMALLFRDPGLRRKLAEQALITSRRYGPQAMRSGLLAVYEEVLARDLS